MVLYNNTVVLTEGNFTFVPSNNFSASYEISNSTDLGALYATGLDFNVSDRGKMAGNDSGNMTEKSLILESIEGYQNNNETMEKWFTLINEVQVPDDIGMNQVSDGDEVKFLYTLEEGGEPVLAEAKYAVMIKVAKEAPPEGKDLIETATQAGNFTTLLAALNATNLTDTLKGEGPYTVFAPTDEAFAALPNGTVEGLLNDTEGLKNILLYHVAGEKLMATDVVNMTNITTLQGSELPVNVTEEGVFVGKAKITMQDVETSNGIIHVIDAVLIPPEGPSEGKDIIETATSKGFKTLLGALNATNLTDTLKGEGPYTLFAPTDNAFATLPNQTREALLNDTDALKNILLYHVAGEKLMAEDVANMTNITTLQGSELPVNVTEEGVFVGDAKIILQDLNASNGVIHAIDAVLIPPKELPSKWYFFSIPFKAENASVENLLAGVQYNALVYYNGSSGIYENVSTLEPLKGYWINVPGGVEFNASAQFASAAEASSVMSAPQSIKLYPGWNAVGSPVKYNLTADSAFITIGTNYSKVMGPWITDEESGSGTYAFVGYNGLSGVLNGNQVGTDIFEVKPYEGYWVYMKQEGTFA
ncbi:MAG: fasciclin domain-containing protein [Methanosarcina sp.]|nr:fasciclin domain-containing protein [Methanosarcina sp.]